MKTASENAPAGEGRKPRVPGGGPAEVVVAALALAGPVVAGAATGHLEAGMAAAVGGMAMGDRAGADEIAEPWIFLAQSFVAVLAALLAGSLAAAAGAAGAAGIVALAVLASLLGGASRPLAVATTRFVLFMVISSYVAARYARPVAIYPLFAAGAAWGALLGAALVAWRAPARRRAPAPGADAEASRPTARERWARWARSLRRREGWLHTLQLGTSLGVAEAIQVAWPGHHTHWVALTVAIVVRRPLDELRRRAIQRGAGTAAGVVLGSFLLWPGISTGASVAIVVLLAAARAMLRTRNPAAYAAVMTPLMLTLMEFGQPFAFAVLVDRLLATLVGCALALAAGALFGRQFLAAASGHRIAEDGR